MYTEMRAKIFKKKKKKKKKKKSTDLQDFEFQGVWISSLVYAKAYTKYFFGIIFQ